MTQLLLQNILLIFFLFYSHLFFFPFSLTKVKQILSSVRTYCKKNK